MVYRETFSVTSRLFVTMEKCQSTALESRKVWWCSFLRDSATNVVLLPGVFKLEVENCVGNIYGFNEIDIAAGNSFNPNVGKLLDTSTFVVFYYLLPWVMSRQLFSGHDYSRSKSVHI